MDHHQLIQQFKEKAQLVSATIHPEMTLETALTTAVKYCQKKSSCQTSRPWESPPGHQDNGGAREHVKTIALPENHASLETLLSPMCSSRGIELVTKNFRNHARGMDMGITFADYGIADTGTLVIGCDGEDMRLATMISDIHVALLPQSRIRSTALELTDELEDMMAAPGAYTAFITGPSRTADIERVLAIGVHGPLELHIMLLKD
ncbi:L-lactate dehydrogenase complex protein LldG [Desulfocicer vacuolatum DSM 3385]|uniref:L-lactate dehydrogenase complex protein LldG n=1 Tax=Desulfocicer vacuolatum DSM 3385 TaxID=1121400 RepID=A0A1W2CLN7_9BACT|nr:lactate utilization protein [Desulfocicer vacuolatum]SMC86129.1 L-lactate dehydrogenase complex protein LldG [Desulfocicer vacuolatum DSM 3385]